MGAQRVKKQATRIRGTSDMNPFEFEPLTINALQAEMISAVAKHGRTRTPLNPDMPGAEKLIVLVEEVGEVARAMTYDNYDPDNLVRELIQTAAMALAWAQSLDGGR
jgi:hypothetical protein